MSDAPLSNAAPVDPALLSARFHASSHLRLWITALVGLVADLWTKHWAFKELPPDTGQVVIPRLTSFHRSLNTGALFGLGKGYTIVFIIASILALAFVLFLFIHSTRNRWSLHVALGLVLAGALGNLYDRSFSIADVVNYTYNGRSMQRVGKVLDEKEGYIRLGSWPEGKEPVVILKAWEPRVRQMGVVRDFIRMEPRIKLGDKQFDIWPWVFNIADALLVFGVGILILNFWRERKQELAASPPVDGFEPA